MIFEYKYRGFSKVANSAGKTQMEFVPDARRDPAWFHGKLNNKLPYREAISALHDIVISDQRYTPRSSTEYQEWLKSQEDGWLAEFMSQQSSNKSKVAQLSEEMNLLTQTEMKHMKPFYKAQNKYFKYLYTANRDWWFVLDPVITIHPDEIFFECFSVDESSYGKLSCSHNVFDSLGDFSCGTTNVDYSAALYDEFQKIRNYKETFLTIDPEGFSVETGKDEEHREVKIDLPDTWVRGFLQVSAAQTMQSAETQLHPMDLHNILFHMRRKKETHGPRSLRFHLKPGQPLVIEIDPWGDKISCPRSVYLGHTEQTIRLWGRRRLFTLERLIPVASSIHVSLLGNGMPSFWRVNIGDGDMNFTLGLSGWTANDWSRSANFDLLAPRAEVTADQVSLVITKLHETWSATADDLAKSTGMDRSLTLGALAIATQEGRVIYDGANKLWRLRELSADPLPLNKLRYQNDREKEAKQLIDQGNVSVKSRIENGQQILTSTVKDTNKVYTVRVAIDADERITSATCNCNFFSQNKLMQGPCAHILAARMADSHAKLKSIKFLV
ncbi:MAG: SWIM zinc finger family protein [Akkermansiaceae bacterium]